MRVFVEQVVPVLQQRGLFRTEYEGATLRDHYGLPADLADDNLVVGAAEMQTTADGRPLPADELVGSTKGTAQ
jgi:hypothetical protein